MCGTGMERRWPMDARKGRGLGYLPERQKSQPCTVHRCSKPLTGVWGCLLQQPDSSHTFSSSMKRRRQELRSGSLQKKTQHHLGL